MTARVTAVPTFLPIWYHFGVTMGGLQNQPESNLVLALSLSCSVAKLPWAIWYKFFSRMLLQYSSVVPCHWQKSSHASAEFDSLHTFFGAQQPWCSQRCFHRTCLSPEVFIQMKRCSQYLYSLQGDIETLLTILLITDQQQDLVSFSACLVSSFK